MPNRSKQVEEVLKTLRSLADQSFPLDCSCGETYTDLQDFLSRTEKKGVERGVLDLGADEDPDVTQIMRDCPHCASSLVAVFFERRNHTQLGDQVRDLFDRLMAITIASGLSEVDAKNRLREVMRGSESDWLQKLLLEQHPTILTELNELLHSS